MPGAINRVTTTMSSRETASAKCLVVFTATETLLDGTRTWWPNLINTKGCAVSWNGQVECRYRAPNNTRHVAVLRECSWGRGLHTGARCLTRKTAILLLSIHRHEPGHALPSNAQMYGVRGPAADLSDSHRISTGPE